MTREESLRWLKRAVATLLREHPGIAAESRTRAWLTEQGERDNHGGRGTSEHDDRADGSQ